jgi:uncharacterized protein YbjQ (UPF0145 family)
MLVTTTDVLSAGLTINRYIGVVTGEAIIGANFIRDFMAGITDVLGGRAGSYEHILQQAKDTAMKEMMEDAQRVGANGIISLDMDFETIPLGGEKGSMLMVNVSGTAVVIDGLPAGDR